METYSVEISVVIPTRNRGNSVVMTLESVFQNTHPNFEVILVDQSNNQDTAEAIKDYLVKENFQYIQTDTQGASRARNIGLARARGSIVAFTDDDCTVPIDWLDEISRIFWGRPSVNILFCNVLPALHDISSGTIPHHRYTESKDINSLAAYIGKIGMAAGMAVRSEPICQMGGFDENLGPGSLFKCGEDYDLALRALIRQMVIYETDQISVIHFGFRTFDEFRELTKRDWYGIGATQAKILKCSQWKILPLIGYNLFVRGLLQPMSAIFEQKKPQGFKRFTYFLIGFIRGFKTPVDPQKILFKPA